MKKVLFIGVTGGTASGKTTLCQIVCKNIEKHLPGTRCKIISQDHYYKNIPKEIDRTLWNWDTPDALEWDLLLENLKSLKSGAKEVHSPQWDFVEHRRCDTSMIIEEADIYLIEGIFVLSDPKIREMLDLQIFVEVESDTRLARRIVRDMTKRGRSLESVLYQYENFVKPGFDNFTHPSRRFANIIVPYKEPNPTAEHMIDKWIIDKLKN